MAEVPLKAEYFVTRNDGKMIPLLAVDELPHHISIAGVSRVMSPFDIVGMTCVGRSGFRHRNYTVQEAPELAASNDTTKIDALKAKYFITRDSGNLVPLVAMDEMPEYFIVNGVSRVVSVFDIAGMTCVGLADVRDRIHTVEDVKHAPLSYFAANSSTRSASDKSDSAAGWPAIDTPPSTFPDLPTSRDSEKSFVCPKNESPLHTPSVSDNGRMAAGSLFQQPSTPAPVSHDTFGNSRNKATPSISQSPSSISDTDRLIPGVKEYCSYWIRHGECDYQQQGCLYKHEMPLDQDTLLRLGLRDIPKWYREKHSLGSYLAAGGSGAAFGGQGLASAAACGIHEDDKRNKLANNWRSGARNASSAPVAMGGRPRNDIYNPRPDRVTMNPTSFSRLPSHKPSPPLFNGKLRSNETLQARQQFETIQALNTHAKINSGRKENKLKPNDSTNAEDADVSASEGASEVGHPRRASASTIISDIEALVGRQDASRKAKEDAEYAKSRELEDRKRAVDGAKATLEAKKEDRRGSVGSRRVGKSGNSRGRWKKGLDKGKGKTSGGL